MTDDLIENLFRSLEREMNARFNDMTARFDRLEAAIYTMQTRLDRQGAILNAGSRWVTRMIEWSERHDVQESEILRRLTQLEERLDRLEKPKQ